MPSGVFSLTLFTIIGIVGISLYTWNNQHVHHKMLMNPYKVFNDNEWWRMITSGFIHSGYAHLGFNMFTFYFFGGITEVVFQQILGKQTGMILYVIFFVSAIIISDLPVAWKNRNNPGYNSLGASGAVSAMVFSSILYFPLNKICLFGIICMPGFILGALYVIYSYSQGKKMSDNINHEAHLYGAIYGMIFSLAVYPESGSQFVEQILSYRLFD